MGKVTGHRPLPYANSDTTPKPQVEGNRIDPMENIYAELVALDAEKKTADADTPKLLVENNDESRRIKEMVEKAVNREESRQERMREEYKESTSKGTKRKLEKEGKVEGTLRRCTPYETGKCKMMRILKRKKNHLFPWLFNINQTCSVPQLKIEATTATEVYDTYIKAHNKKRTWEQLRCREKGQ
ncbi:unnamed protein product [Caenorhabditis brenneri]